MIRKVLGMIDSGSTTLSEMARELGMSEADLKSRLEMMVIMGHLEAVRLDGGPDQTEDACPGCLLASTCRDDTCSEGEPVVGYRLTEKARRLVLGEEG